MNPAIHRKFSRARGRWVARLARTGALLVLLALFGLAGGGLFAQGRDSRLNLSWKNVPGARGYIVQIRDVGGKKVLDRKTPKSQIDFNLPPGDYTVRMAAVNKFNKPAAWSKWQDIRIRRPVQPRFSRLEPDQIETGTKSDFNVFGEGYFRETELYLERENKIYKVRPEFISTLQLSFALKEELDQGDYDLVLKNPGGKVTRASAALRVRDKEEAIKKEERKIEEKKPEEAVPPGKEEGFYWKAYVPGLPEAGDPGGYIWPGTIATLLFAGGLEYSNAEFTRELIVNDPMYPAIASPSILVAAVGSRMGPIATAYTAQSVSNLSQWSREYQDHLQRASLYGGAALLVYTAHALRYRLGFSRIPHGAMIPGMADLSAGNYLEGGAWLTGFAGFTALAIESYNQANSNVRSLESDPIYRVFNDPLLLAGLRVSNTTQTDIVTPAYLATLRHQETQREYVAHQNRFGLYSAAAATIFLTHYILKKPAGRAPEKTESVESGTSMRLDVYPEANNRKTGTRAEVRFQLRLK